MGPHGLQQLVLSSPGFELIAQHPAQVGDPAETPVLCPVPDLLVTYHDFADELAFVLAKVITRVWYFRVRFVQVIEPNFKGIISSALHFDPVVIVF